ncbi:MAG: diadenylate cyclase CdaA [candidate division KSB1 bacterium]|nr:diadenylate cyclase CdaA [candidate division KSB1 bacterium]
MGSELFKIGFISVALIDIVDIAVISFILYKLYLFIRGSRAAQMFVGLLLISIVSLLVQLFNMSGLNWILQNLKTIWLIAFVVLFQPELRRILIYLGQSPLMRRFIRPTVTIRVIEEVIKAAVELSKRGYGGMFVLVKNVGIKSILESGTLLHAEVTAPLLVSIFNPRSPLHDGAVVIQNDVIEAAQCILPLSQQPNIPPHLGTRHRAAIGLSEESDAAVIVVSEETGMISLTLNGELQADLDHEKLRKILDEFYQIRPGL